MYIILILTITPYLSKVGEIIANPTNRLEFYVPQKQLKKWLPKPEEILANKTLGIFAPHLADPRLWHFNRRCLSTAIYIGVMSSFFPLPGQMLLALIFCLIFRANVPMAIALTWITNPLTTIPIFYFAYWVGTLFIDTPMISFHLIGQMLSAFSLWIFSNGDNPFMIYKDSVSLSTFTLGLTVIAIITSIICGVAFRFVWRFKVVSSWKKRHGYRPPHLLKKYQK